MIEAWRFVVQKAMNGVVTVRKRKTIKRMETIKNKAPRRSKDAAFHREFPEFKINQMRWALHAYRWYMDVNWACVQNAIRHTNGLSVEDKILGDKDPKNFALHGKIPDLEKLRLYENFLKKDNDAKQFAASLTSGGLYQQLGRMMALYADDPDYSSLEMNGLCQQAKIIAQYFYSCEPEVFMREHTNRWEYKPRTRIIAFRAFKNSPWLVAHSFVMRSDMVPQYLEQSTVELDAPHIEDDILRRLPIQKYFVGILSPDAAGRQYAGLLKGIYGGAISMKLDLVAKDKEWKEVADFYLTHENEMDIFDLHIQTQVFSDLFTSSEYLDIGKSVKMKAKAINSVISTMKNPFVE